jgi:lipooligosaccharide transport system permease protein
MSAQARSGAPGATIRSGISLAGAMRSLESEWLTYKQAWRGSVFSTFLGPLLYLGAIGFGLGSLVEADGSTLGTTPDGEPVTYLLFLAPALVAATGIQVAAGEGIFGTMARTKWRRTWFTAIGTPLMPGDLALGHLLWVGARGGLASLVYALVAAALGAMPLRAAPPAVGAGILGGIALGAVLTGWLVRSSEEHMMNAAQRFVVIPMFLFSGVFFPVDQLPGWMAFLARLTPMWHAVVLAREGAIGTPTPWGAWTHVGYLLAFVAVGFALAVSGMRKRLLA